MELIQNNAIVGVPTLGPFYIHNYFSHTHQIFYVKNYLSFDKINFSMILIKSQLDLKQFFISMVTGINMNDSLPRHYITQGHSVNFSLLFPLKEG